MNGFQLTLFTQQGRRHGQYTLPEWLLKTARELGIKGATISAAEAGYGRDGRYYSAHFFESGEQPVEVVMVLSAEEQNRLFERLKQDNLEIFYSKVPVEWGLSGSD